MLKQLEHHLNKHENPVVACSFGKDSLVVLHMVLQIRPDIAVVFNNTKCEYPDTLRLKRRLLEQWNLNLVEVFPNDAWTFWKVVEKYGFPLGQRRGGSATSKCCYYLKKAPMLRVMFASLTDAWRTHPRPLPRGELFAGLTELRKHSWDLVIDGLTIHESRQRYLLLTKYPDDLSYRYHKKWNCHKLSPIRDWTPADVWAYISANQLPYNSYYDCEVPEHPAFTKRGIKQGNYYRCLRVGCWACTIPLKYDPFYLTHLRMFYPKLHFQLLKKGLAQFLLDKGKGVELFERLGTKWIVENRPCYFDGVTL